MALSAACSFGSSRSVPASRIASQRASRSRYSSTSAHTTFNLAGGTHSSRPSKLSSTNRTNTRAGFCVPWRTTITSTKSSIRRARYAHACPGSTELSIQSTDRRVQPQTAPIGRQPTLPNRRQAEPAKFRVEIPFPHEATGCDSRDDRHRLRSGRRRLFRRRPREPCSCHSGTRINDPWLLADIQSHLTNHVARQVLRGPSGRSRTQAAVSIEGPEFSRRRSHVGD